VSKPITFVLNGREVEARTGETIWQVANRLGIEIPHLCYSPEPGYRADGNCRACMVEVQGERVLAASCIRQPTEGMQVSTVSERAKRAREMVFELLVADQPRRERPPDPESKFWRWAARVGVTYSRLPARERIAPDSSHTAMRVNLDACIHCTLCVRACREVQVNDVIGMAYRGHGAKVIFDFDRPMGESTCVACGECVQACPTGALMETSLLDDAGVRTEFEDRDVDTVCPYCGVGCQLTLHLKDDQILYVDGRDGPANRNRICVKGRFGFDYISHPHRLTKPMIRRADAPKQWDIQIDPANPWTHFREAAWEEAMDAAAGGLTRASGPTTLTTALGSATPPRWPR
jgi:formate dehydrogenase major subunit